MTDKTTLTRYANGCAAYAQNGQWVLFSEAHTIELERNELRQRNEDLEARIASLTRLVDASELAIQERNNLIVDLKIRIEGLECQVNSLEDCLD